MPALPTSSLLASALQVTHEVVSLTSPRQAPILTVNHPEAEGRAWLQLTKVQLRSCLLENSLGRQCAQLFLTLVRPTAGNLVGNAKMNEEQKAAVGGCSLSRKQPGGVSCWWYLGTKHQVWGHHSGSQGDVGSCGALVELMQRLDKRGVCPGCGPSDLRPHSSQ